jgi:sphingosine kinase
MQLSIKVAERDKVAMADALRTYQGQQNVRIDPEGSEDITSRIPHPQVPKYPSKEDDDWLTFDKPILFLLAGKGPYVARFVAAVCHIRHLPPYAPSDLMAFPVSLPDDGVIDIVVQELVSLLRLLPRQELRVLFC